MELPQYLRTVDDDNQLAQTVTEVAAGLGFERLCVVSGPSVTAEIAAELAAGLGELPTARISVPDNSRDAVDATAASEALADADAVVAVGGGKTIDVAKLACEQREIAVISVPTQLTADGIASPISVIAERDGHTVSVRARMPIAVVADLGAIEQAPPSGARAGLGDLLANPSALHDWRLAAEAGHEPVDDFAALLAQTATDLVHASEVAQLGGDLPSHELLGRLLEGLVLSGIAMEIAGSSRPCSGSEHLFSHALDRLRPGTALHGEQVALGSVLSASLQGRNWQAVRDLLVAAGMEGAAAGFGLSEDELVAALELAPSTRPQRYTVLDQVGEAERREAVARALG
jgi:glycerol-1-phosphate dehydrogenase [NAD(P)+]